MNSSWGEAAGATRGRILAGDPCARPSGYSLDSRTLQPGDAFFAIVGPVHDGHDHVVAAVARGACGVVVARPEAGAAVADRAAVLVVEDTTRALQDLAEDRRRRSGALVAALTGSVGKTTTKELARLLISGDRRTHASPGNLNNHYGLPLALLAMPSDVEACVLELGISTPGEMDRLVQIAQPDLGLVTLIASAHAGNFASEDELAEEKMKLPRGSGRALLNCDDAAQWSRRATVPAAVLPFGEGEDATPGVRLLSLVSRGLAGSELTVSHAGRTFALRCPLPGGHHARNLLAATALALAAGVPAETVIRQASSARPGPHRGEVIEARGVVYVDDTYNSNPAAMRAAIALLAEAEARGRRILVVGDMRELGASADDEHRRLGVVAAAAGLDIVLGVGEDAALAASAAQEAGADAHALPDAAAAGEWLARHARPGDVVLLKGSRAVGLEGALEAVLDGRGVA